MKTKLVNRYYCDFCRKASCSASHMSRHEKSCTANPDRRCRMCEKAGLTQSLMSDLLVAVQRDIEEFERKNPDWDGEGINPVRPVTLIECASGCPACVLAAIRQTDSHWQLNFKYLDEVVKFWRRVNKGEVLECHHG